MFYYIAQGQTTWRNYNLTPNKAQSFESKGFGGHPPDGWSLWTQAGPKSERQGQRKRELPQSRRPQHCRTALPREHCQDREGRSSMGEKWPKLTKEKRQLCGY